MPILANTKRVTLTPNTGTATIRPGDASAAAAFAAAAAASAAAAAAVGTSNDAIIAGRVTTAGSATDAALKGIYLSATKVATGSGIDPTGSADSSAAVQALLDAMPATGGRLVIPENATIKLATGLVTNVPNLEIVGGGGRGQDTTVGAGSARLHYTGTGDAFVFNSAAASTVFRGPVIRNLMISGTSSATGAAIRIKRTNNFILENVAVADFSAGTALVSDGTGNVNQYATLNNFQASRCLNGIDAILNNGLRLIGGYLQGNPHPIATGSYGIRMRGGGDTLRLFGMDVQGFDILCDLQSGAGNDLIGFRGEDWTTAGIKIATAGASVLGGSLNNTLNSGVGIGIWCTSAATRPLLFPANLANMVTTIQDDSGAAIYANGAGMGMSNSGSLKFGSDSLARNATGGLLLDALAGSHLAIAESTANARVMNFRKAGAGAQNPEIALQSGSTDGPTIKTEASFARMVIDHAYTSGTEMVLRVSGTDLLKVAKDGTVTNMGRVVTAPAPSGGDDQPTLQTIVNALATAGGGNLDLRAGIYRLDTPLLIGNKVTVRGQGRSATIIQAGSGFVGAFVIKLGPSSGLTFASRLEKCSLDVNGQTVGVYANQAQEMCGMSYVAVSNFTTYGIQLETNVANVDFDNLELYPKSTGATAGMFATSVQGASLFRRFTCGVSGLLAKGIHLSGGSVTVQNVHVENCTDGILADGSNGVITGASGPTTAANVTNIVRMANNSRYVVVQGVRRNSATNSVRDDFFNRTITDDYVQQVVMGDQYVARLHHNGDQLGFFNTTPIAKRATTADATDLATAITLVNALKADLQAYGLKA